MIRSIRPTDVLALLTFNTKHRINGAKTWEGLLSQRETPLSLMGFLQEWLALEEHRLSWIATEDRQVQGLISMRHRPGTGSAEIDRLILAPGEAGAAVGEDLLEYVSAVGVETGIGRIFMRVAVDTPLLEAARRAGFLPYSRETLYALESPWLLDRGPAPSSPLRPRSSNDEQALFRLYCSAVPLGIRRAEAMTLQEWRETPGQSVERGSGWELVLEGNGCLLTWLRITRQKGAGRFELLVHPDAEDRTEPLVRHSLAVLDRGKPVFALVPDYQIGLQRLLEEADFRPLASYQPLVKQLAVRVRLPRLMPVRA